MLIDPITLVNDSACPACGPGLLIPDEDSSIGGKLCRCCGRTFEITLDDPEESNLERKYILSIGSVIPKAGEEYPFTCAFNHPEHKWPVIYNNPNKEPLSEEEKNQSDGKPITPMDFSCCSQFNELRDLGHIYYDLQQAKWFLSFPRHVYGDTQYDNYELLYCPGCGSSVP